MTVPPATGATVVVADDEIDIRELVEMLLTDEGFRVVTVPDGTAAVEVTRRELPAVLLLDVMMPGGMDGLEAVRLLRADPLTADVPIALLTARARDSHIEEGLAVGADEYLVKPFDPATFVSRVHSLAAMNRGTRA